MRPGGTMEVVFVLVYVSSGLVRTGADVFSIIQSLS